jgi:exopolyphosphatase / guanosine-5'-triphosphate,3'-diphosphate pyrophosphatase
LSNADRHEPARPLEIEPERVHFERKPYGIIDIGSNSVRLVVYDQLARAPLPRFNEKAMCRLGEGLAETGEIKPENFRRTIEAVRRFLAIAKAMGVEKLDATATEAMRRARNGPTLAAALEREAGAKVRILTGEEEARFSTLGVISGFFRPVGVMGDMGGGSLELAEALDDHVGDVWASLPLGALPVESMLEQGVEKAKKLIDAALSQGTPGSLRGKTFYAVGGGWRALAKAHLQAVSAPVPVVHGYALTRDIARGFAKDILKSTPAKLRAMPGVVDRRARTLPAAAMMLDRTLKFLNPDRVVFSALGLREGFIYAQLSDRERYLDPLVEGAQLIGLPLARVADFAPALLPWTAPLFPNETPAERRLRVAVAALSDLAWRDHQDLRAEESFRRVLQFPFIGVSHADRAFLATALHARYAGKTDAPWLKPAIDLLDANLRKRAMVLGRAILLGYRLSGGVPHVLSAARLRVEPDAVVVEVGTQGRVPDSEVVGDRLKLLVAAMGLKRGEVVERR